MKFNPLSKIPIVSLLKKSLSTYTERNKAIAENIANVETRGYRPYRISFEDQLRETLQRSRPNGLKSDPRHMTIGGGVVDVNPKISIENQPVNIEQEMGELAMNQIRFEFATRKLSGAYQTLSAAIRGQMR